MDLRTWIFVANRKLTAIESVQVENALEDFVATWSSHGTPLKASAFCFKQAAIVVVANELVAKASGCSIDKITHLVQTLGQQLRVNFFDRFNVLQKDADDWSIVRFSPEFHAQCISASIGSLEEFNKKAGDQFSG